MGKIYSVFLIFTVFLVAELLVCCSGEEANATFGCILRERNALLRFKASLSDPSGRLWSWNASTDCCKWEGIMCDETSGHVIALDLQNERYYDPDNSTYMLHSETLDSSLLVLKHLFFLDLSGNDFHLTSIPSFLGSMDQMQHLNLSCSNFSAVVPHNLGNLSLLSVLDLSYNTLIVDDFTWVSHLSFLKHLNMSRVDLSRTDDLLKVLNMLPFLIDLRMSGSGIENRNLQHACVNSTLRHLEYLDLTNNSFHGNLPCFLENMTSLRYLLLSFNNYTSCDQNHLFKLTNLVRLNLRYNSLQCSVDSISEFILDKPHLEYLSLLNNSCYGDVSKILLNLSRYPDPKLTILNLGQNQFHGQLPKEIGGISKLKHLSLYANFIGGPIPPSIGNLRDLEYLNLVSNQLTGEIPKFIGNLSALKYLYIYKNQLSGLIPSSLGNLSALETLDLSNNQLSGLIPYSLGNLSALKFLSLSYNQLNGEIACSFFDSLSNLQYLTIEFNSIKFVPRSDWITPFQLEELYMGFCDIGGVFPQWILAQKELRHLSLPNCSISGEIPESLCEMKSLYALFLTGNSLSGSLPECLGNLSELQVLGLASNRLSGVIPYSIGRAYALEWLRLSGNKFSGELPYDLRNCSRLTVLDVQENAISGKVPEWIGNYLLNLRVLQLRSNELYDTIPSNLCQLSGLQVLDLAINKLTGNIPHCIHNFTRMEFYNSSIDTFKWFEFNSLRLMIKGVELDYADTLRYVVYMDLSSNNLVGEIPLEFTRLGGLLFLNLSNNHLQGHIPRQIGDMNSLESLDLSNNNLSGNIPQGLSELNFLSHLNLSHNKLTGEIPTGNQLQTLDDASIYEGNPGLCGGPLPNKCHEDKASPKFENHDVEGEEDKSETIWFCGVVISGFATGFWGAIGVLVFKIGWRRVYFKFTDGIIARLFGA